MSMRTVRILAASATLSLALLGSAPGATDAQDTAPFGRECVSHIARMHGGVGPHIQEMHSDTTVGRHLSMMRTGEHECGHHMDSGME